MVEPIDKYVLRQTILQVLNTRLRGAPVLLSDLLKAETFLMLDDDVAAQTEDEIGRLVREGFVDDRGAAIGEEPYYQISRAGAAQITRNADTLSPFIWGRKAL